ncbi:MAG: hypothetical protein K2X27_13745 [Candidatus Obscuribacterales bacterium]|nr:hypothetical protein [Candidatus Obscuribacterales bacterium]
MSKNSTNRKFSLLLISASLHYLAAAVLPAAYAGDGTLISWLSRPEAQQKHQEKMKYTPSLAYVPTYTGRGFISTEALHSNGLPTGESYNLKYLMRESADIVHNWYQEALRQNGWTIDENVSNTGSISANRGNGLNCYIYTRPTIKSGFACEVIMRYSARPLAKN